METEYRGTATDERRPRVVVRPSSRIMRLLRMRRWVPRVSVNPDGTVTVKVSLVNHGDVDATVSIRLRHREGWWFTPDDPELTVQAQHGPVDVSSTFRPAPGQRARSGDELAVEVEVNGVPVAETRASLHRPPVPRTQLVALSTAVVVMAAGTAVALDRTDDPAVKPCNASTMSGGAGRTETTYELGRRGPMTVRFEYDTARIPDEIGIRYGKKQVFHVGPVGTFGPRATVINLPAGRSTQVEVIVTGPDETEWDYTLGCPAAS